MCAVSCFLSRLRSPTRLNPEQNCVNSIAFDLEAEAESRFDLLYFVLSGPRLALPKVFRGVTVNSRSHSISHLRTTAPLTYLGLVLAWLTFQAGTMLKDSKVLRVETMVKQTASNFDGSSFAISSHATECTRSFVFIPADLTIVQCIQISLAHLVCTSSSARRLYCLRGVHHPHPHATPAPHTHPDSGEAAISAKCNAAHERGGDRGRRGDLEDTAAVVGLRARRARLSPTDRLTERVITGYFEVQVSELIFRLLDQRACERFLCGAASESAAAQCAVGDGFMRTMLTSSVSYRTREPGLVGAPARKGVKWDADGDMKKVRAKQVDRCQGGHHGKAADEDEGAGEAAEARTAPMDWRTSGNAPMKFAAPPETRAPPRSRPTQPRLRHQHLDPVHPVSSPSLRSRSVTHSPAGTRRTANATAAAYTFLLATLALRTPPAFASRTSTKPPARPLFSAQG
ncbi:hypothetical protein C8R45DRAFT_922777 [Mycena sanguinolenta]|nr:hypothetical protein C8R45DRAFT_922777 [Mycena sanguinolenta]